MTRKIIAVVAAVMAGMLLSGTFDTADARKGGWRGGGAKFHGGFRSGKFYSGGHHRRHHRRHGFRRHFFVGVPLYYGAYYGGYYGYSPDCYWLKRKARRTGSRYWWHRYRECLYDYGY
jgi:hypothetical protein